MNCRFCNAPLILGLDRCPRCFALDEPRAPEGDEIHPNWRGFREEPVSNDLDDFHRQYLNKPRTFSAIMHPDAVADLMGDKRPYLTSRGLVWR